MKISTFEEEKTRRTAIQLCVQTGLTPTKTAKKLKSRERYSCVSRSPVFKLHGSDGRFSDRWADSVQRGQEPYRDVGNVRAA